MNPTRAIFAILISFLGLPLTANQGTQQKNQNPARGLTVNLALNKTEFWAGESFPVKIQITNPGDESLLIGNSIYCGSDLTPVSRIEFDLKDDEGHIIRPTLAMIADSFSSEKYPNPATAFLNSYLLLHPGYSLSTQFRISPQLYGGLKPGYYRLSGTYTSSGLFYPPVYNQAGLSDDDVKSVPYKAWRGKISTNELRFRVLSTDPKR